MAADDDDDEKPHSKGKPSPAVRRDDKGRLLPGNTANPGGRAKRNADEEAAIAEWSPKGKDVLARLYAAAKRGNVQAANSFLDRVWGKVAQRTEITGDEGGPLKISYAEVREKLRGVPPKQAVKAMIDATRDGSDDDDDDESGGSE